MVTRDEISAANARGEALLTEHPIAVDAKYDAHLRKVIVRLSTGLEFLLNPELTQGLQGASESDLKKIRITGPGLGLHFPKLDVDLYVPSLLDGHFGSKQWAASQLGKSGGRAKSKVKTMAARTNGALGGRPRKAAKSGQSKRA